MKDRLRAVRHWLPLIADQPLQFEPRKRHQCRNSGFILLGAIVEAVAGQEYVAYAQEHVFRQAGMGVSGFFERGDGTPDVAVGYTYPLPDRLQDMKVATALAGRADNAGWLTAK